MDLLSRNHNEVIGHSQVLFHKYDHFHKIQLSILQDLVSIHGYYSKRCRIQTSFHKVKYKMVQLPESSLSINHTQKSGSHTTCTHNKTSFPFPKVQATFVLYVQALHITRLVTHFSQNVWYLMLSRPIKNQFNSLSKKQEYVYLNHLFSNSTHEFPFPKV